MSFRPNRQVPGVYHHRVGDLTVTAINDGVFTADIGLLQTIEPDAARALEARHHRPSPPRLTINAFVVSDGTRTILVDAGATTAMAPTVGKVPANLAAAGVDPATVDTILLTHLHPDHIGALTSGGAASFPNAEVILHPAEAAFWLSPETLAGAPEGMRPYVEAAQAALKPYASRQRTVASGEALPGITAEPLPGHTPGHTGWLVSSGGKSLLIWGDIVHVPGIQFTEPGAGVAFDADGPAAVATRKRVMDRVATDGIEVAGMHLDFPAIGHVARDGAGYRWLPTVWTSEL